MIFVQRGSNLRSPFWRTGLMGACAGVLCSLVVAGSARPAAARVALRQIEIRAAHHLVLKSRMTVQLRGLGSSGELATVTYGGYVEIGLAGRRGLRDDLNPSYAIIPILGTARDWTDVPIVWNLQPGVISRIRRAGARAGRKSLAMHVVVTAYDNGTAVPDPGATYDYWNDDAFRIYLR